MSEQNQGVVLAIGGFFFRSSDPDRLSAWYKDRLGVGAGCAFDGQTGDWSWRTQGGDVVFAPFRESSDYFAAEKRFMLNFRVSGLDGLVARLESAGVAVERRDEWDQAETGRFARIHDPDGNPIELWEPPAT